MLLRQFKSARLARNAVRRGAAAVETAAVVSVFLLFLFGVFEYCRMIYVRQVVDNAAREGARYAIVNTYNSTLVTDTQAVVKGRMGGLDQTLQNYACNVYASDASGNNLGSPLNVAFGKYICCDVKVDYSPIVPSFLFLNQTLTIRSKCLMGSEAN
jgi:Flp pilus assembly protein TadG